MCVDNSLRSIIFFQKQDITQPWGEFDVQLNVKELDAYPGSKHIGPMMGTSMQHTGHS